MLIERGRADALEAGFKNPNLATCIRRGIFAAAKLHPMDITDLSTEKAWLMVRLALFDLGPATIRIEDDVAERVEQRLQAVLHPHLADETAKFSRYWTQLDSLVHQIAKQKKRGGTIHREVVRSVLLNLVLRSFRYVADCVHLQMSAFQDALQPKLNERERAFFKLFFLRQPFLGNLPLIMLQDRFEIARDAIKEMWDQPFCSDNDCPPFEWRWVPETRTIRTSSAPFARDAIVRPIILPRCVRIPFEHR